MGNRENASAGIKLVYKGEIITLIADVLLIIVGMVFLGLGIGAAYSDAQGGLSETAEAAFGVSALVAVLLFVVALIMAIVGFIKNLKGLKRAGKDNNNFSRAFYYVIFVLAFSVLGSIFLGNNPDFSAGLESVGMLMNLGNAYYIIKGCSELLPGSELVEKGRKLIKWIVATGIVRAVCNGFTGMEGGMVMFFNIASLVLTVVWYLVYLSYLKKAKETL